MRCTDVYWIALIRVTKMSKHPVFSRPH